MRGLERAGIAFGKTGKELCFTHRVIHPGIASPGLGLTDREAELGALAQEFEELGIQRVYLHTKFGESGYLGWLCHGVFLIFPGCLP